MLVEPYKILDNANLEYLGCSIRAASYQAEAMRWMAEACMSIMTEDGPRKLWVSSFAHCFGAENLTFANQSDADDWALAATKAIIDRANEKLESNRQGAPGPDAGYFSRMLSLTRQSFLSLRRAKPNP